MERIDVNAHAAPLPTDGSTPGRCRSDSSGCWPRGDYVGGSYRCRATATDRQLDGKVRKLVETMDGLTNGDRLEVLKRFAMEVRFEVVRTLVLQYRNKPDVARGAAESILRYAIEDAIRECRDRPHE